MLTDAAVVMMHVDIMSMGVAMVLTGFHMMHVDIMLMGFTMILMHATMMLP